MGCIARGSNSAGPTRGTLGMDCWGMGAVSGLLKLQTSSPPGCQPLVHRIVVTLVLLVAFTPRKKRNNRKDGSSSGHSGWLHLSVLLAARAGRPRAFDSINYKLRNRCRRLNDKLRNRCRRLNDKLRNRCRRLNDKLRNRFR